MIRIFRRTWLARSEVEKGDKPDFNPAKKGYSKNSNASFRDVFFSDHGRIFLEVVVSLCFEAIGVVCLFDGDDAVDDGVLVRGCAVDEHVACFNRFRFFADEDHDVSFVEAVAEPEGFELFVSDVSRGVEPLVEIPPVLEGRRMVFHAAAHNSDDRVGSSEEDSDAGVDDPFDEDESKN